MPNAAGWAGDESPARGGQRSPRLHPHHYRRLPIAARKARRSMQSILTVVLESHRDTVAPVIRAEVFERLMGWSGGIGGSAPRGKSRPAHWRAQGGRKLGLRRLRAEGLHGALPPPAG